MGVNGAKTRTHAISLGFTNSLITFGRKQRIKYSVKLCMDTVRVMFGLYTLILNRTFVSLLEHRHIDLYVLEDEPFTDPNFFGPI